MSEPRKHHYISQFYLKWFSFNPTDENPQCFFYHIPSNGKILSSNIENIATKKDLFALTLPNWLKEFWLEKDFSKEESKLAYGLSSIIDIVKNKPKELNNMDRSILIDLIMFQFKRSAVVSKESEEKIKKVSADIKKELKEKYPDNNWTEKEYEVAMENAIIILLQKWKFEKEFDKNNMTNVLLKRNRYFYNITDYNKSFVTSDMPLYRYTAAWTNDWLENSNTRMVFPLSSKLLLLIYWEWWQIYKVVNNNKEFIKRANWIIISNATNFIIGNNEKLIQKMKDWKNWWTRKYLYPKNVLFLINEE